MKSLIFRLWREYMRTYTRFFVFAFILMIFVALSTAALPYLLQPVFDDILNTQTPHKLFSLSAIVFITFLVKGMSSYGESVIMAFIGQRLIADIQFRLFSHLLTLDLAFFHGYPSGEIVSRLTQDISLMRQSISNAVVSVGKDTLTLLGLVGVMVCRDPTLSLIALVGFPLAIIPMVLLGKKMRSITHQNQNEMGKLTSTLIQIFQGIRVVKAYNQEESEKKSIHSSIQKLFNFSFQSMKTRSLVHPIMEILSGLAIIGVVIYGGWQVMTHTRTTGEFVSFMGALLLLYEPLKRLSHLNSTIQEGLTAAGRIFSWLDLSPTIKDPITKKGPIRFKNCTLRFDHVHFGYQKDVQTLFDISFVLEVGKSVAFVGSSGAGKTTIINLIPRFYDVGEGSILINDVDIRSFPLKGLRNHIALVSQDVFLFEGSVIDNLKYGSPNATQDDIERAVEMAASKDFIEALGYHTPIGENGVKLSGGQRQRISIIRAMLKDAPILLLDEATSSLDTLSQNHIQTSLQSLMKGRSTLIVSHRLQTIIDANMIYVLDKGKIVGSGTHASLLRVNDLYQKLYLEMNKP